MAVDNLSFSVPEGQCFGLLGVNGAGKSTTFKMLTGDIGASEGDAYILDQSIRQDLLAAQKNIGYCPQTNAIFNLLTAEEHLRFYAALRGIHPESIDQAVDWSIRKLSLEKLRHQPAGTFSGGNKRKLCVAIAIIGAPKVVFLDEPTAGMDPGARRFLWDCVLDLIKENHAVILTSHSMEECEVLCSKLAIMVNGKFQCIGSPQHLKNKFGKGYILAIKVADEDQDLKYNPQGQLTLTKSSENLEKLKNLQDSSSDNQDDFLKIHTLIKNSIPGAVLKEQHANMLQYQLPAHLGSQKIKLADIFRLIEDNRREYKIIDYSLSQTTLDDVFVGFAKYQTKNNRSSDNLEDASKTSDEDSGFVANTTSDSVVDPESKYSPVVGSCDHQLISSMDEQKHEFNTCVRKASTSFEGPELINKSPV